jgi:predicted CXXCH cytochrome family protein
LLPDEKAPPGDVLHWTGRYQTANTMCIGCHTTGFEKRYDAGSDSFASRWSEPNVSCQSCHGAGERHLHWAQQRQQGRAVPDAAGERYGLSIKVSRPEGAQQVELCSPCHSRRSELADSYRPGEPRLDHFLPSLLTPSLYHADGQQLDEVYVDGSFRQSKMYGKGVGCLSCHDAHTGKLRQTGNAVCLQCHAAPGPIRRSPRRRPLRRNDAPLPQDRVGRCLVRELPHAGQDLHAGPGPARPQPAQSRAPICR